MSQKFGVTINSGGVPNITAWEENEEYQYIIIGNQISQHNGNGLCQFKVLDSDNNLIEIEENGWTINPVVDSPFNWTGSSIKPKVTDPKGQTREIFKGNYSATIFKGLSYHKDITALFSVLNEYSKYSNWCEFDLKQLEVSKDEIIHRLQLEIIELKNAIKSLN
jgi:hypothetical protein